MSKNLSRLQIVEHIVSIKFIYVDLFELLISNTDESHYNRIPLYNWIVKKGNVPPMSRFESLKFYISC